MVRKVLIYIRLFLYFARNWNARLALFILWHEIRGEWKYGLDTTEPHMLEELSVPTKDIARSSRYEAVNYYMLEKILKAQRKLSFHTTFTDLGCGKGRPMVVAAHMGFQNIYGVDFAPELCNIALNNMRKQQRKLPNLRFDIACINVKEYPLLPDQSVFFLFNPFGKETLLELIHRIDLSVMESPRTIFVIYVSPRYLHLFRQSGYKIVYRIRKMKYLDGVILQYDQPLNYHLVRLQPSAQEILSSPG